MVTLFWLVISYFLGAIPFGLVISKTCCGIDPREQGSGNIGATNVNRLCGSKYGALTLVLDILKGLRQSAPGWSGRGFRGSDPP